MSFQEKNIAVSLATFVLIMGFYLASLLPLAQSGALAAGPVFRLWGIVAVLATVGTVALTIATHVASQAIERITTRAGRQITGLRDERDNLIDLRGTSVAYRVSSIGVALAMLTLVFGQPPLVMFTLIIFVGLAAQIIADLSRLYLYRKGV